MPRPAHEVLGHTVFDEERWADRQRRVALELRRLVSGVSVLPFENFLETSTAVVLFPQKDVNVAALEKQLPFRSRIVTNGDVCKV